MASPPLTLADNLTEELQKDKCKVCKLSPWVCDGKRFKCMECDKYYYTKFNEDLIKRFENTYRFCNWDISEFCIMLSIWMLGLLRKIQ